MIGAARFLAWWLGGMAVAPALFVVFYLDAMTHRRNTRKKPPEATRPAPGAPGPGGSLG